MARMADAFMRGFGFADQMIRNHRNDQIIEEERARVKSEREGFNKGIGMYIQSKLGQEPNEHSYKVFQEAIDDPLSAAEAVERFSDLQEKLDMGTPADQLEKAAVDYFNLPSVAGNRLKERFGANGLSGKLSGMYPAGGDGVFFEADLTTQDGKNYKAPLTVGKTAAGQPGSEQDEVQVYKLKDLMEYGTGAAVTSRAALEYLAQNGGTQGAIFAANYLNEQDKAKRTALLEEFKYQRERADKLADRQFDLDKINLQHKNAIALQDRKKSTWAERVEEARAAGMSDADIQTMLRGRAAGEGGGQQLKPAERARILKDLHAAYNDPDTGEKEQPTGREVVTKPGILWDTKGPEMKKRPFEQWLQEERPDEYEMLYGSGEGSGGGGGTAPASTGNNNVGNMRTPGSSTGFQKFGTVEESIAAIDKQLQIYGRRDGIDTVRGVISKWSPPNENQTDALVNNAAKMIGVSPDQKIDLSNPAVRHVLSAAIIRQEGNQAYLSGIGKGKQQAQPQQPVEQPPAMAAAGSQQPQQAAKPRPKIDPKKFEVAAPEAPSIDMNQSVFDEATAQEGPADTRPFGERAGEAVSMGAAMVKQGASNVADAALAARDFGESFGTTDRWKKIFNGLSSYAKLVLADMQQNGISTAQIVEMADNEKLPLEEFLVKFGKDFAKGLSKGKQSANS